MKAYKVVSYDNGKFLSCGSGLQKDHALCLEYKVGEITIAWKGTVGIFIFKNYFDALRYGGHYQILEIEALAPIKPVTKVASDLHHLYGDVFKPSKYKKNLVPVGQQNYIVPANSFLCRKIKVIGLAKERC